MMENNLKILQTNVRGIKNKKLDIKNWISKYNPDIITVNESGLYLEIQFLMSKYNPDIITVNESFLNKNLDLFSHLFFPIFLNRKQRHGGGSIVLIGKKLSFENVNRILIDEHEVIQVKIVMENNKHLILNIYISLHVSL